MKSFCFPALNDLVSNIETSELLHSAFHFIPGKRYLFDVVTNGEKKQSSWEVNTDPYNNAYIKCHQSGAMAYFINDGKLLYFTHFSGDKNACYTTSSWLPSRYNRDSTRILLLPTNTRST